MLYSLISPSQSSTFPFHFHSLNSINLLLPKTLFPGFPSHPKNALRTFLHFHKTRSNKSLSNTFNSPSSTRASLIEAPILWAGRLCIFYALLRAGLAGSQSNPLISGSSSFWFSCFFNVSFLFLLWDLVFIGKFCVCVCVFFFLFFLSRFGLILWW